MTTKSDIHKKAMIEALEKTLGIVTPACEMVGISRQTHYRWLEEDPEYKANVQSMDDLALDFAEPALPEQIKDGTPSSTMFYLKTKGKKRSFVEKQEVETNTVTAIKLIDD